MQKAMKTQSEAAV